MSKEIWKEVFRTGEQTDANGNTKNWTETDLDLIVAKYNNQNPDGRHDAPVVIGHPVNNSPAYAWVQELKRAGNTMFAKFTQIEPQFEDLIKEGRFKKVSIALYPDMMLRHVGFLGAIPPAVKGLKDANFSSNAEFAELTIENGKLKVSQELKVDSGELTVKNEENQEVSILNPRNPKRDLSESYANASQTHSETYAIKGKESKRNIYNSSPSKFENFDEGDNFFFDHPKEIKQEFSQGQTMNDNIQKMLRELLNWLAGTYNQEIANQTQAEILRLIAVYFNEPIENGKLIIENENERQLKEKIKELENENREIKFNEYFKSQTGRLVPAQKQIVKLAFEAIRNNGSGFQFSENGKTVSLNGEDLVKRLIESFPLQVEFNEIARKDSFSDSTELEEQNKFIDEYNKNK